MRSVCQDPEQPDCFHNKNILFAGFFTLLDHYRHFITTGSIHTC